MEKLDYKTAGVNVAAGNQLVNNIKHIAQKTHSPAVLSGIGGFAANYELPIEKYRRPVLVSATDGVGTKLKVAIRLSKHNTIGIDLVAMCVNDLICQGAEPLYFLDYYATGNLSVQMTTQVIESIAAGCQEAGISLIGGETAEMPGMYASGDYDLAGFSVGIIEKEQILRPNLIQPKDVLIGITSSGLHANGFALVRKILERDNTDLNIAFEDDKTLADILLTPTKIYVKSLQPLFSHNLILGSAHITGGGLTENIPRMLPDTVQANLFLDSWQIPKIFTWLQAQAHLPLDSILSTLNCGVGMVLCVSPNCEKQVLDKLHAAGETAWTIGKVSERQTEQPRIQFL